jgi:RNA polymerase sigma-70 factor (ECF subfamily)
MDVHSVCKEDGMRNDDPETGFTEAELLEQIPAVRNFARRFHPAPGDLDDLVQETLTKAIANSDKFRRGTQLRSWLFTILRNSFCTKFGLSKRETVGLVDDCATRGVTQPTQEWNVRGRELEEALVSLPDRYRTALELVFIQGASYEEAAKHCRCPVGTMKSRVNRARLHLAKVLDAEDS